MENIKHAIQIYKEGRFKVNSENNMDVDSKNVQRQVKKGRTLFLCDCTSHTKFCNSPVFCRHKLFFLLYPLLESMDGKLSNLICEYEAGKSIMKTEEGKNLALQYIDDLRKLRRFE